MSINLIDKIKQKNDADFKLVDASDLEFDSAAKTIATGAITQSDDAIWNIVDTEGAAASDDLATITRATLGPNMIIISPANGARTVVIKHGTGNILCVNNADITLDDIHDFAILAYDGSTNWYALSDTTGGGVTDGDKGDITVSLSGATWTVDNDAITYAKMQNVVADQVLLGNIGGAGGVVDELTATEVRTLINVENGADVTDTTNVTAAGALMDSEVDPDIKTLVLPADTTISTFGASLVDDTSANAARTTLGANQHEKSITVEDPGSAEDISMFFTNRAITITEMRAVLIGSSTPSVTWTVRHYATDRSNAGNEVVTSGTTTTSTSTGSDVTSFNDATIPADSYVWLETTAQSGTVTEFNLTIVYTLD